MQASVEHVSALQPPLTLAHCTVRSACCRCCCCLDVFLLQIYDELHASELAAHEETLDYLAGLDRARILKKTQREATEGQ